ncbi:MAG TPA: HAMP domain-containing sensor histidine kinase, partial [Actinomycetes bacterium]|nr:HAMP domain-containing sensor histidine kinase [Actinomycetes bacterium]
GLVTSVKSYSQMDRGSFQRIDVTDGVESTLVMFAHKLTPGVDIVREYADDVPQIDAFAGELNQVWTNLIDNAIDAMDGQGTITLSTSSKSGRVVVQVADTGSGMTPEVVEHIFDTFFTTKDVGKGTGLGLSIARRIVVDQHGGDLAVESAPGHTVFSVTLPVHQTSGDAPV